MTTYTAFTPNNVAPFQFQPTLDGSDYIAVITWNVYGQRWYLNLYTTNGTLVVCRALIASPDATNGTPDINLMFGYFQTSTMVFRDSTQTFEVSP